MFFVNKQCLHRMRKVIRTMKFGEELNTMVSNINLRKTEYPFPVLTAGEI
jgi:hypothetical protein